MFSEILFTDQAYPWEFAAILLLAIFIVSGFIWKKTRSTLGTLSFFWICFSALRIFGAPTSPFLGKSDALFLVIADSMASMALNQILLLVGITFILPMKIQIQFFKTIAVINCILILALKFAPFFDLVPEGTLYNTGVLLNASMGGCFAVCLMPLFLSRSKYLWAIILSTLATVATLKNLPLALLFCMFSLGFLQLKQFKNALFMPFLAIPVGYFLLPASSFGENNGRLKVWGLTWDFWCAHINPWIGSGTGTYAKIGPIISSGTPSGWPFLHNDWFQILFEQGIIGAAIVVLFFSAMLYHVRKQKTVFLMLALYGLWGVANWPTHHILSAWFGVFLLRLAFEPWQLTEESNTQNRNFPDVALEPLTACRQFFVKCGLVVPSLCYSFSIRKQNRTLLKTQQCRAILS